MDEIDKEFLFMQQPFGYIYITINKITGNKYIGQHRIDYKHKKDNYIGSGTRLWNAIRKYGIENFEKTIIENCQSRELLNEREKYWISFYNAQNDPTFYNITAGGDFGNVWDGLTIEEQDAVREKIRLHNYNRDYSSYSEMFSGKNNPCYGKHWYKDIANNVQYYLFENDPLIKELNLVKGLFRTKEHNKKIGLANKGIHKESPSSGKICMNKDGQNTYVFEDEVTKYELDGWNIGGKSIRPVNLNKVLVIKSGVKKYVLLNELKHYLNNGFIPSKNFIRTHKSLINDLLLEIKK